MSLASRRKLLSFTVLAALQIGWLGVARASPAGGTQPAVRQKETSPPSLHPWTGFWTHLGETHSTQNLGYYTVAVVITPLMISWGIDEGLQTSFQRENPMGQAAADVTYVVGYAWHVSAGAALWLTGLAQDDPELAGAGSAALQALASTMLVTTAQKLLTGRQGPRHASNEGIFQHDPEDGTDDPGAFGFDFWNRESFLAEFYWPSGHTATAFAVVAALDAYYPREAWIPAVGYPFSTMIGLLMIDGDYHWASDVVAGAIIGYAMGRSIGTSFRNQYERRFHGREPDAEDSGELAVSIAPNVTSDIRGLAVIGRF